MWADTAFYDLQNTYALFRHSFDLPRVPEHAPLFITADQSYRLYLNGQFICRGPARGFQASWPYDEVDVAPFLRAGQNVVAIRAHHPGCGTFCYISQHMAGVLVSARWNDGQDDEFILQSGVGEWRGWRQSGVRKDTVPSSFQLFPQEHMDLRLDPRGWQNADFDDSGWTMFPLSAWNCPPWHDLEPRAIPMLREETVSPRALVAQSEGDNATGFREVRDVVALAVGEGLEHETTSNSKLWREGVLTVAPSEAGRFRSFVLDFGRVVVGNLELEIEGAVGGEVVDALFCEVTREEDAQAPKQTPFHDPQGSCNVALGTRLVCRAQENHHVFYHPYGFRFLTLRVRDAPGELRISPRLHSIGYPLGREGAFESSDPLLEQIWEACAHTQRICSLDAYVDTPWREQAQWWGDARVQAWNTFHLCDDARLLRRGIKQIGQQQLPNGLTYGHAPTIAHTCVLPDFTLIWILTQWDYYFQTGSLEAFQSHQEETERALDYFRSQTDEATGLVRSDERYWLFLDWTCLPKDGYSSVLNLWLVLALEKLAQMHEMSGQNAQARELEAWSGRVRAGLEQLVNEDGLLCDGIAQEGTRHSTTSVHAQTLALMAGLRGVDEQKAIDEVLLPFMALDDLPDAGREIRPSAYWVTYVFSTLTARGHGAQVVRFIRRFWEPMARFGSTWEDYAGGFSGGSRSHAWSAHPLFHFAQIVGGLTQTAPAWKAVRFAPVFEGESGGVTIPTPHGLLQSHWETNGSIVHVQLLVPAGVEVEVELPGLQLTLEAFDHTKRHNWRVNG